MKSNKKKNVRGKVDILKRPFIFKIVTNIIYFNVNHKGHINISTLGREAELSVYQVWLDVKTLEKEGYLFIGDALNNRKRPVKLLELQPNRFILDIVKYIGSEELLVDIKRYVEKNLIKKYTSKNLKSKVEEVTGAIYLNIIKGSIYPLEGRKNKIPYLSLFPNFDRYLDIIPNKDILKEANKMLKGLTQSRYLKDFILCSLYLNVGVSKVWSIMKEERTLDGYYTSIINHEEELLNKNKKITIKYKTKKEKKEDEELINTLKIALRSLHYAQKTNYGLIGDFVGHLEDRKIGKNILKILKTLNLNK